MKSKFLLLTAWAVVCFVAVCPQPAAAYIGIPPQTLGELCRQSTHIYVLQLEKFSAEREVLLFKPVAPLKMTGALSDATLAKQVIGPPANGGPSVNGAKVILDWAAEGKKAVLFAQVGGIGSEKKNGPAPPADHVLDFSNRNGVKAQVCIDGFWYSLAYDAQGECWRACKEQERSARPALLSRYCGTAENLRDALTRILRGEEVEVPALAGDTEIRNLRASLQILGDNPKLKNGGNPKPEPVVKKPDEKKPEAKKPAEKKPEERKPDFVGTVKALSADGKSFKLQPPPTEKNKEPTAIEIHLTERTKITDGKGTGKLAVGQIVSVWRGKGEDVASEIQIGKPGEKPEKKPEEPKKKPEPEKKPTPDATEKKPEEPKKPKEPPRPVRDPAATAAVIDTEIDRHLATIKVPASPQADDAEFLRRVTLDLTGRIPTYQQTVAFLDNQDPAKRRKLIDELLDSPEYGEHFATIWRNLLVGRELNLTGKGGGGNDAFRPWLAEQFNDNRGWNAIVADLLTAEGTPRDNPATAFLITNGENSRPQPNKVTGSVAALFWGVNLRCAECHNHPFAPWKQNDFWGTAAFFGKVQYGGGKGGGPQALAESSTVVSGGKEKGQPASPMVRGAAIAIPAGSGKAAGQVVKARFLGGAEPALDEQGPFRPPFAAWATAADHPYFARAAVNRMWAHFFGRGFVHPLDAFDTGSPSHPELLDRLAKEFADSGFDLKHLARCITSSKAYQRSSYPVPGNETDTAAFSHMAVKVLTPEVLYDALGIIGKESSSTAKSNGGKGSGDKQESREQFLRSFRIDEDVPATEYLQGIPQLLRLMNASSPNRGAAIVEKLYSSGASRPDALATLYLTVLSRRPTPAEVELMTGYLSRRKDDREGYRGVLWMLLNSSEFALNR